MIIAHGNVLFVADDSQELVDMVYQEIQGEQDQRIMFSDSTGEEFAYSKELI